jgi:hypothetical protein
VVATGVFVVCRKLHVASFFRNINDMSLAGYCK